MQLVLERSYLMADEALKRYVLDIYNRISSAKQASLSTDRVQLRPGYHTLRTSSLGSSTGSKSLS